MLQIWYPSITLEKISCWYATSDSLRSTGVAYNKSFKIFIDHKCISTKTVFQLVAESNCSLQILASLRFTLKNDDDNNS